ncbi:uncharacterized protein L3040_001812 [Drepanopeziza brunnea f. sp. 'multigermtubi']|uniref:uncharacterized protein n=1 Tax=Drepanopeziza brunnea f. sp. 'multigermtubi' TaxID=698441 RepID=UPI00238A220B|nr:hypothetical protein L3040_001812 [Drepanopeziza brunnea f. sp. 'multigermtubi']
MQRKYAEGPAEGATLPLPRVRVPVLPEWELTDWGRLVSAALEEGEEQDGFESMGHYKEVRGNVGELVKQMLGLLRMYDRPAEMVSLRHNFGERTDRQVELGRPEVTSGLDVSCLCDSGRSATYAMVGDIYLTDAWSRGTLLHTIAAVSPREPAETGF